MENKENSIAEDAKKVDETKIETVEETKVKVVTNKEVAPKEKCADKSSVCPVTGKTGTCASKEIIQLLKDILAESKKSNEPKERPNRGGFGGNRRSFGGHSGGRSFGGNSGGRSSFSRGGFGGFARRDGDRRNDNRSRDGDKRNDNRSSRDGENKSKFAKY